MLKQKIRFNDLSTKQRHQELIDLSDEDIDYSDIPPLDELFSEEFIRGVILQKLNRVVRLRSLNNGNNKRYIPVRYRNFPNNFLNR